ncbi:D-alanine--D-alanine ligase [Acidithiobacillus sp. AMEEHan]|uniref:D-alanine--D-alanine ligase n=1 Tax=Acidithiobacillus sp. AMEEHan TaxID=2994951 RepID=UPI0027E4C7C4|nr:D-alanine--D-alanine ligase [Acidithiobacillus sp. AMEEHan]
MTEHRMSKPQRIGVLYGGPSEEREVSRLSGAAVLRALQDAGLDACGIDVEPQNIAAQLHDAAIDMAFNVCHGAFGEDGHLQASLDNLGIPYTGSGVLASALSMDKWRCKRLWQSAGLPTTRGILLHADDALPDSLSGWGWPLFVKPNRGGSSIGVSRVGNAQELETALGAAFAHDSEVLVEAAISGKEVTVAIVHGRALPPIVIEASGQFYDYHAKYIANDTRYLLPSGLGDALDRRLQDLALQAFSEIGGSGWGRVDFLLDTSGAPALLEINSVPGMTSHSLVPMAAQAIGWSFGQLCRRILDAGEGVKSW